MAETIAAKAEVGLSAQRIFQDLVLEHGFSDSYESVKRFVRKLRESPPRRVWRMECEPGEEMQVDFGLGAPIQEAGTGKARQSWVFRAVLSYSRKGYRLEARVTLGQKLTEKKACVNSRTISFLRTYKP